MKNFMKECLIGSLICYSIANMIGLAFGIMNESDKERCTYDSLASRMTVGYVAGCELGKPRFKQ